MEGEELVTLELALGVAAALLAVRLWAFRRAEAALAAGVMRISQASAAGDARGLRSALRGLAGKVPFGDWSPDWLRALDSPAQSARQEALEKAQASSVRRVVRRAARGQALDLTALAVLAGLGAFANSAWPVSSWFWSLGGLLVVLLIGSVILRGALGHSVRSALETLRKLLGDEGVGALPVGDRGDGARSTCERCGGALEARTVYVRQGDGDRALEASFCADCGTWTGVWPAGDFRNPSP
ncbi:MAG TPA: hypothetical protein VLC09_00470 [Polyangiaceae bacterium]|nr:hypothetical protein [Polyangiaceae bacterium]